MATKKVKKSETQKQYEKQFKRIKNFIREAVKRGYTFAEKAIPQKLKRPTKRSVEKLSKITPEVLYQKAKYKVPITDEMVTGIEGRKIERKLSAKKAAQTRRNKKKFSEQYTRELTRINRLLDDLRVSAKSRGYLLPKDYLNDVSKFVNQLNPTKDGLMTLESITEESLLSSSEVLFKDPRTGTIFKGYEGLKIEDYRADLQERYKLTYNTQASETDRVLELVRGYLREWTPSSIWSEWFTDVKDKDKNQLERQLNGAILTEGEEAVAQRMQDHAEEILDIVQRVLYGSGGKDGRYEISFDLIRFSAIILGRSLTQWESEEITDISESNEVF